MTLVTLPSSPGFVRRRWGPSSNTQVNVAPISKVVRRLRLTGERWVGEWTLRPMGGTRGTELDLVRDWTVFFADLDGRANSFLASPPYHELFRGTITGAPLVDGAGQTGKTVDVKGLTAGDVVAKGQWLQFATTGQLVMSTAQRAADGSGLIADLAIKPRIRVSPADNEAIEWETPTVEMISLTDELSWDVELVRRFGFVFAGEEVF